MSVGAAKGAPGTGYVPVELQPVPGLRVGIAVARFNAGVTDRLLDGALSVCDQIGIKRDHIEIIRVAGAFELPLAAQELIRRGCKAVVCLGAVIRGETPHFDYVCQQTAAGVMRVALDHHVPVGFGVLTCDTAQQAYARAGGQLGNKGAEAMAAALELAGYTAR